jgi:hypothetical protein
MAQVGSGRDLAQKSLVPEHGGKFRPQHLDGHLAIVLDVVSEIDDGHTASTEFVLDDVSVCEGG